MIPEDFKSLLPQREAAEIDDRPHYYLWVFDPQTNKVHVESNEGRDRSDHLDHSHLADAHPHPDRVHGYAYLLRHHRGFRVTDWDHKEVKDPYIKRQVEKALEGKHHEASVGSQAQSRALR